MTTVYLTRHGETEYNAEHRFQGWLDSALTENGVENARALGERLKNTELDRIYTSPLPRAKRTAEIIRGDRPVEIVEEEGLKEINFGKWDGMLHVLAEEKTGIKIKDILSCPERYALMEGEDFYGFADRVKKAFHRILSENTDKKILIVTHYVPIQVLIAQISRLGLEHMDQVPLLHPVSLTEIHCENGRFELAAVGDIAHLEGKNSTAI